MKTITPPHDAVLSLPDAADALTCSLRRVHTLISSGALKAVKSGRRTLIRSSAIESYIASLPAVRAA